MSGVFDIKGRRAARAQLKRDVALMRSLGVARWTRGDEDIFLGPPPSPAPVPKTIDEEIEQRNQIAKQRHEVLFAASSTRPVLPESEQNRRASVLKSVVPRPPAQDHDNGKRQA